MIHEVTMYAATCDNCGEDWEDGCQGYSCMNCEQSLMDEMDDWHIEDEEDGKTYCPQCFFLKDNGELVINSERTKK